MNQPSRSDHYLMQIALVVARSNSKHPGKIKMQDFELEFKDKKTPNKKSQTQRDLEMQWSKHIWAARLGTTVPPSPAPGTEYEIDEPLIRNGDVKE